MQCKVWVLPGGGGGGLSRPGWRTRPPQQQPLLKVGHQHQSVPSLATRHTVTAPVSSTVLYTPDVIFTVRTGQGVPLNLALLAVTSTGWSSSVCIISEWPLHPAAVPVSLSTVSSSEKDIFSSSSLIASTWRSFSIKGEYRHFSSNREQRISHIPSSSLFAHHNIIMLKHFILFCLIRIFPVEKLKQIWSLCHCLRVLLQNYCMPYLHTFIPMILQFNSWVDSVVWCLQSCTAIIPNMKCDASASVTAARAVNGSSRKFTVPRELSIVKALVGSFTKEKVFSDDPGTVKLCGVRLWALVAASPLHIGGQRCSAPGW